jgi:HEAT repeat protein
LPALSDPEPWVRYYACQSLGKLRVESSVDAIARLTRDGAGQVRVAAIEALSHLPGDVAFAGLREAAGSPELDLRRAALIGLGMSGREAGIPILLSHADSEDAATRLIALSALSNFETPATLAALLRAARDPDENVETAALGFLGTRRGAEATLLLTGLLKEPAARERAWSVLSTPQPHRVAGLSSALQSADDELAVQLTRLLARLSQPEATAALFEGLTLPNAAARKAAATTLGALGSREALAALQRLSVEDSDPEVRRVCSLLLLQ